MTDIYNIQVVDVVANIRLQHTHLPPETTPRRQAAAVGGGPATNTEKVTKKVALKAAKSPKIKKYGVLRSCWNDSSRGGHNLVDLSKELE
jgi:hypothetical protein